MEVPNTVKIYVTLNIIEKSTRDWYPMSGTGLDALRTVIDASGTGLAVSGTVTRKNDLKLCEGLLF